MTGGPEKTRPLQSTDINICDEVKLILMSRCYPHLTRQILSFRGTSYTYTTAQSWACAPHQRVYVVGRAVTVYNRQNHCPFPMKQKIHQNACNTIQMHVFPVYTALRVSLRETPIQGGPLYRGDLCPGDGYLDGCHDGHSRRWVRRFRPL